MSEAALGRDEFRAAVFKRDGGRCVVCGEAAADAHHVVERRLWPDGGCHLDNGASLCAKHHLQAEQTLLSCEDIRKAAGIKKVILPDILDPETSWDKWGNPILPNGSRGRGQLFWDSSVQAVLQSGGVLDQFSELVKFPRIRHLPWSLGRTDDDISMNASDLVKRFHGQRVIVTEKIDGEVSNLYQHFYHARSLDSGSAVWRNWLKAAHAKIAHDIPDGWRVCGENMFAVHSIEYSSLPSYFLVFAVYDEQGCALDWPDTEMTAAMLGFPTVPVLWQGVYNEESVRRCWSGSSRFGGQQEGYVLRMAGKIPPGLHTRSIAKFVREGHVQTTHHWRHSKIRKNGLAANQPKG